MKTTVLLEDHIYAKLVNESLKRHGTAKSLSLTLNELLKKKFTPPNSMFGKLKRFSIDDLREKHDRSA